MPKHAKLDLVENGFTILEGVYSAEEVAAARTLIVRVIEYAERGLEDPFDRYYLPHRSDQGVLYDVVQRHPGLWQLARSPQVLDIVASVLGDDVLMYENSVVYKPKGKRNSVPFHQDFISRPDEPLKLIAWTALEPVTVASGAMKVIPGSHRNGFLPWHRVKGETHHDRINESAMPTDTAVYAELEPGDVLIFNQLLVHGSDEVHTDSLRVALRVSYQGFGSVETPRGTPLVMRGGDPEHLATHFPRRAADLPRSPLWKRIAHLVGRRLTSL
ncbi:MAG TPA: phytanoyl-CoA dioxygenase family protein [Gammaproteobacteria bacterium]|nr:phytanoyl-CoA dioxygenase family protein [Gammaproteobacteria bacterium]